MAYQARGEPPIRQAAPVMITAMILLVLGGIIGIGFLSAVSGVELPLFSWTTSLLGTHWFIMIYGFTLALVGMELLTLLSLEWSGRIAPTPLRLLFVVLVWAGVVAFVRGEPILGLGLGTLALLILTVYSWITLMRPSHFGIPPGHYNLLVSLAPALTALVTIVYIAGDFAGIDLYRLESASTMFIVLAIIAVLSRDVPLLLGVRPTKEYVKMKPVLARRAKIAYAAAFAGILLSSAGGKASVVGGLLVIAASIASLASLGLPQAIQASSRTIPREIIANLRRQVLLAHAWLALGGAFVALHGALSGSMPEIAWGLWDMYIHAITLGFMFNIIMGVDAVLLYGHAGIPLSMVPRPQILPSALLNLGLALRLVYGLSGVLPALAPLSGLVVGGGIIHFYARNILRIARIIRSRGG